MCVKFILIIIIIIKECLTYIHLTYYKILFKGMVSCPLCNEEFESEELLQKHMITHDNVWGRMKFSCLICKEKFDNVLSLRKHMKSHLND